MADEERKRYAEEIYKNFDYEIIHNLKIATLDDRFKTPFRVSYFVSIQNDLDYVSGNMRDEMRSLYSILEEINVYIEKYVRMGLDDFKQYDYLQYAEYNKLYPKIIPALQKAMKLVKSELENLQTMP